MPTAPTPPPELSEPKSFLRHFRIRRGFILGLLSLLLAGWFFCVRMPGSSYDGVAPAATPSERQVAATLQEHMQHLSIEIGARSTTSPGGLEAALVYLEEQLTGYGYEPLRIPFEAEGQAVANLEVEIIGSSTPDEVIVVGAHYDGFYSMPAANDNGSGTAALLALAERFADAPCDRTLRFVFFTNEEPPHFQEATMGSLVYAEACRARDDNIRAMWSLETLGYYSDEAESQRYPIRLLNAFYPSRGNFITFVGNMLSSGLVRRTTGRFRRVAKFPSEGAALPSMISGVGWSDHWSFAKVGYSALMVTDTAVFRDPEYHQPGDLPGRLDTARTARVVEGLGTVLAEFVDADTDL